MPLLIVLAFALVGYIGTVFLFISIGFGLLADGAVRPGFVVIAGAIMLATVIALYVWSASWPNILPRECDAFIRNIR